MGRAGNEGQRRARDALSIQRLKNAGAVIFGKTNVPLRLADFQSYNDIYGTTNNPWDKGRTPGGSSGGSAAALAAGLTGLETGSDIGGSIRNPAHFCGVFGHKPTWNLLPPRGHAMPGVLTPADISVIGPLARSARDLETALLVMAGPDEIQSRGYSLALQRLGKPVSALRVAVWSDDPDGAGVEGRTQPRRSSRRDTARCWRHGRRFGAARFLVESLADRVPVPAAGHDVGADPRQRLPMAAGCTRRTADDDVSERANTLRAQAASFRDWSRHNEARTHLRWAWHAFFERYDVLLTPIMPTSAFPHDHRSFGQRTIEVDGVQRPYFEQVFWAGLAGVSLSAGDDRTDRTRTRRGLPIGMQIIGPEYGDLATLEVAQILEQRGYSFRAPPGY